MLVDLEKAKGGLREFGSSGSASMKQFGGAVVSETKAATAAFKALDGGFANNSKVATAFITKIAGMGPVLQAAFPVFGALAFAGTITPASKIGGNYTYHIDARGADLGAENRVARAIEAVHDSAVHQGARASAERAHRIPRRTSR